MKTSKAEGRIFLVAQWVKLWASSAGPQVQSLVKEVLYTTGCGQNKLRGKIERTGPEAVMNMVCKVFGLF